MGRIRVTLLMSKKSPVLGKTLRVSSSPKKAVLRSPQRIRANLFGGAQKRGIRIRRIRANLFGVAQKRGIRIRSLLLDDWRSGNATGHLADRDDKYGFSGMEGVEPRDDKYGFSGMEGAEPRDDKYGLSGMEGVEPRDDKDGLSGMEGVKPISADRDDKYGFSGMEGVEPRDDKYGFSGMEGAEPRDDKYGLSGMEGVEPRDDKDGLSGMEGVKPISADRDDKYGFSGMEGVEPRDDKYGLSGTEGVEPRDDKYGLSGMEGVKPISADRDDKYGFSGTECVEPRDDKDGLSGMEGVEPRDDKDGLSGMEGVKPISESIELSVQKKKEPAASDQVQKFLSDARELIGWSTDMITKIRSRTLMKTFDEADQLVKEHSECKEEIVRRYCDFTLLRKKGIALIKRWCHHASEVEKMVGRINETKQLLNSCWEERDHVLKQCRDYRKFEVIERHANNCLSRIDAILKSEDLGTTLYSVKALLKKHNKVYSMLEQARGLLNQVREFPDQLNTQNNFAKTEITKRRQTTYDRFNRQQELSKAREAKLHDSMKFQLFLRNLNDVTGWITENLTHEQDKSYGDQNTTKATISEHKAFMTKITTHREKVDAVISEAKDLMKKHHYKSEEIKELLGQLETNWRSLIFASMEKQQRLVEAHKAFEFNASVDDLFSVMAGLEKQLMPNDRRRDLNSAKNLHMKQQLVKKALVTSYQNKLEDIEVTVKQFKKDKHFMCRELEVRAEAIRDRYAYLLELCEKRKIRIVATPVHQLYRDVEEVELWINERMPAVTRPDDEDSVVILQQKFDEFTNELNTMEDRVTSLHAKAKAMLESNLYESEKIRKRVEEITRMLEVLKVTHARREMRVAELEVQSFKRDADDIDDRINEQAVLLDSEDVGRDLKAIQSLQKKLEEVERDMTALQTQVEKLESISITLCKKYPDLAGDIAIKQTRARNSWQKLKELSLQRKKNLVYSYQVLKLASGARGSMRVAEFEVQSFKRDADDIDDRINEQAVLLDSEDVGRDLKDIQSLQKKLEEVERDMTALQTQLEKLESISITLCKKYPDLAGDIAIKQTKVRNSWQKLKVLSLLRKKNLIHSYQVLKLASGARGSILNTRTAKVTFERAKTMGSSHEAQTQHSKQHVSSDELEPDHQSCSPEKQRQRESRCRSDDIVDISVTENLLQKRQKKSVSFGSVSIIDLSPPRLPAPPSPAPPLVSGAAAPPPPSPVAPPPVPVAGARQRESRCLSDDIVDISVTENLSVSFGSLCIIDLSPPRLPAPPSPAPPLVSGAATPPPPSPVAPPPVPVAGARQRESRCLSDDIVDISATENLLQKRQKKSVSFGSVCIIDLSQPRLPAPPSPAPPLVSGAATPPPPSPVAPPPVPVAGARQRESRCLSDDIVDISVTENLLQKRQKKSVSFGSVPIIDLSPPRLPAPPSPAPPLVSGAATPPPPSPVAPPPVPVAGARQRESRCLSDDIVDISATENLLQKRQKKSVSFGSVSIIDLSPPRLPAPPSPAPPLVSGAATPPPPSPVAPPPVPVAGARQRESRCLSDDIVDISATENLLQKRQKKSVSFGSVCIIDLSQPRLPAPPSPAPPLVSGAATPPPPSPVAPPPVPVAGARQRESRCLSDDIVDTSVTENLLQKRQKKSVSFGSVPIIDLSPPRLPAPPSPAPPLVSEAATPPPPSPVAPPPVPVAGARQRESRCLSDDIVDISATENLLQKRQKKSVSFGSVSIIDLSPPRLPAPPSPAPPLVSGAAAPPPPSPVAPPPVPVAGAAARHRARPPLMLRRLECEMNASRFLEDHRSIGRTRSGRPTREPLRLKY